MSESASNLSLVNKNVLLGVTGGIAAYKSAELVRRLQDEGASVRVVMTRAATEFITPLTLQALSGHPVHLSLLDPDAEAGMGHIELARWADVLLVAPATADFLAKLNQGLGDELLLALCLASAAPLLVAPAMNQEMWHKPVSQQNTRELAARGVAICGPDEGLQACGDTGPGRMLEVSALVECVAARFNTGALAGKRLLITAGPTREAIDPVRYISNRSSGKMGYALAQAALDAGARVALVSGPCALAVPDKVQLVSVQSALEMHAACMQRVEDADIVIGAAAVADYRPAHQAEQKIKKTAEQMTIALTKNPDIIADMAASKGRRFVAGFAAETEQLEKHALIKLQRKGLDAIFANNVAAGAAFDSDENEITIYAGGAEPLTLEKRSKTQLARALIQYIAGRINA